MLNKKSLFWTISIILITLFLLEVKDILFPFLAALFFAYLLDPLVYKLVIFKIKRPISSLVVSIGFFAVLVMFVVLLVPLIYQQLDQFISIIPKFKNFFNLKILPFMVKVSMNIDHAFVAKLEENINNILVLGFNNIAQFLSHIWQSGFAIINMISLLFLTPILTFYCLRDFPGIKQHFQAFIPTSKKKTILEQLELMNKTLSAYIRGQTLICLCLACFYGIGLSAIGLELGLFMGIMIGILSFIPYLGAILGVIIACISALIQFNDVTKIWWILALFAIIHIVENFVLIPKLIGKNVGLHPVWILFSMMAGGSLFGFIGVVFAIPVAAVLGVLVRFLIRVYINSAYYK